MGAASLYEATGMKLEPAATGAAQLVSRIEAHLAASGWESGSVLGPETALADQFHASPNLVRQALRILESRGLGHMRRGLGGGLVLQTPGEQSVVASFRLYLAAHGHGRTATERAGHSTELFLQTCRSDKANQVARRLIGQLRATLDEPEPTAPGEAISLNRALGIARRLMAEAAAGAGQRGWRTIADLSDHFSVGRPVMTQAVRVLEDLEIMSVQRGRSGGLALGLPSVSMPAKVMFGYFAARQFDMDEAAALVWTCNRANALHAATASPERRAQMRILASELTAEEFITGKPWNQIAILKSLADLADNPVWHMLQRSMFAYQMRARAGATLFKPRAAAVALLGASRRIALMVAEGRAYQAADAIDECAAIEFEKISVH